MEYILGFTLEEAKQREMENTLHEIHSQSYVWKSVYQRILGRKIEIKNFLERFDENTRVILTGAGSSGFVGDSLAPIVRKELNFKYVESVHTTDITANPEMYLRKNAKTLLVSFGRSGSSPESLAAIETAEKIVKDISHIIITCNPEGKLAGYKNGKTLNLLLDEINDKGFAMTASVTGMMLAAYSLFNIHRDLKDTVDIISNYAGNILNYRYNSIYTLFDPKVKRLVVLGSGNLFGAARESALKSIELTAGKLSAWYDSPMGFRHGPKALLNENTVILYFVSNNEYARKYDIDMLRELSGSVKHKLAIISDKYYPEIEKLGDAYFYNSTNRILEEGFTPYAAILIAQIFALNASLSLECTPDNPFPGGEVNRVVQGVSIHKF